MALCDSPVSVLCGAGSLCGCAYGSAGRVFPSPARWRDQIFCQLLPDRFSDGREDTRPLFDHTHPDQFTKPDKAAWMAAGNRFLGARSPELTIAKPTKTP